MQGADAAKAARPGELLLMTEWSGAKLVTVASNAGEVHALDPATVAFHFDRAFSDVRAARPDRHPLPGPDKLSGVGSIGLSLLFVLMATHGRRLSPWEVSKIVRCPGLADPVNFSARLRAIRRALGEGGQDGGSIYFLPSERDPFRAAWNAEATFRVIEPVSMRREADANQHLALVTFHGMLERVGTFEW